MKRKDIKNRIKEYFFTNPTARLKVRQIERATKTALPSVIRYTNELEKENILKCQDISNNRFYSADRSSKTYRLEKKLFNIKQLSELCECLVSEYSSPIIILFGSYLRGEDVEDSDIDLYIETPSKKKLNLEKFEKELKRKVQIFKFRNIKEIKNKQLANNIINGITLNGFLEVFK